MRTDPPDSVGRYHGSTRVADDARARSMQRAVQPRSSAGSAASFSSTHRNYLVNRGAAIPRSLREVIRNSRESLSALARKYGLDRRTVAKWKKRDTIEDVPKGPKAMGPRTLSVVTRHGHIEGLHPERFRGREEVELTDLRVAKYNRLLEIGVALGPRATFGA